MWYGNPQGTINMTWAGSDVSYTSGSNLIGNFPYFMNDTSDYHLQSISSAIDAGITLSPIVINDLEGTPRPQGSEFDMGAYEFHTNTTGIESVANNSISVTVFPNPAAEMITVRSEAKMSTIEIISSLGEKIFILQMNSEKAEIDLSNFPSGNYFMQVRSEKGITAKKIIVQR
jgi:hypothetical protein